MSDMNTQAFAADSERQRLLEEKLGTLLRWVKPKITKTVGFFDPFAFDAFDAERLRLTSDCVDHLAKYSADQIAEIVAQEVDSNVVQEWSAFRSAEIAKLIRHEPLWYLGGFGHPDYVADFEPWSKMSSFRIAELTCLSIGMQPNAFTLDEMEALSRSKRRPLSQPLEFLAIRFEQFKRRFCPLSKDEPISPTAFLTWVDQFKIDIHSEFLLRMKQLYPAPSKPIVSLPSQTRKQDPREVDSMAKLFTGIVIDCLGYNPRDARSTIPQEVMNIMSSLGMEITDDTIRRYLKRGAEFISEDWEPPVKSNRSPNTRKK